MERFDKAEEFDKMSDSEKQELLSWIYTNLNPIKSFNIYRTSYDIKELYESASGKYITNGQFKGAMLAAGFKVQDKSKTNWCFNVSKRSPAFRG